MKSPELKGFLESEVGKPKADDCLFHVIPAGFEETVSYGMGTAKGPSALIEASQYLEVYDGMSVICLENVPRLPYCPQIFPKPSTLPLMWMVLTPR